jgi:hypothetical protein
MTITLTDAPTAPARTAVAEEPSTRRLNIMRFGHGVHGSGAGNCHVAASHPGRRIPFVNGSSFECSIGAIGRKPMIGNEALSGAGQVSKELKKIAPRRNGSLGLASFSGRRDGTARGSRQAHVRGWRARCYRRQPRHGPLEVDDLDGQDCRDHSCSCLEKELVSLVNPGSIAGATKETAATSSGFPMRPGG